MPSKIKSIALVVLTALGLAPLALAVPPLDIAPKEGMLLLKNGRVIEGKITRDGDRYYVALPSGEIRIKAANVEVLCRGLDECYRYRRSRLEPSNITHHLELAQWCVQRGLLGYAAQELAVAVEINPQHPRIPLLERRLFLARQEPKPKPSDASTSEAGNLKEELDRLVRSLPRRGVEQFTATIQPILQNSCSTAACHGPQSKSKFRLQRISNGRIISQRVTQRNLQATLQMILRNAPSQSPLLTEPVKPHGTAKNAIFTSREIARYKQLVDWVQLISRSGSGGVAKAPRRPPRRRQSAPNSRRCCNRRPTRQRHFSRRAKRLRK